MKNKKMEKIIFEAVAIALVASILTTNVQAEPKKYQLEKNNDPILPYFYFVFGKGYISEITINGETDKIGSLDGLLSVTNKPGWSSPDYKFYVFNKTSFKLYTKNSLPEQFTLEQFSGFGYIKYINIPHSMDATKFFIVGKAVFLN